MNKKILLGAIVILVIVGAFFIFNQSGKSIDVLEDLGEGIEIPALDIGIIDEQPSEPVEQPSNIKEFDIIAKQWVFDPSTIEVDFGDTVILNIESIDVDHGFIISEFGVNSRLNTGEKVSVEFVASKKGTFSFFCNVFCGSGHSEMDGIIVVN